MKPTLEQHLTALNADVLKGWLRRMDALGKGNQNKAALIQAIELQLDTNLPRVLARMSVEERCLLAECAHLQRFVGAREFTAKFGSPYPNLRYHYTHGRDVPLLAPFFCVPVYREDGEACLLPRVEEPLRALLPRAEVVKAAPVRELPKAWPTDHSGGGGDYRRPIQVFESERIAPAELARVLRLIQGGKVKVTEASRRPTDATTRLVAQTLVVPDFDLEMPMAQLNEFEREFYTAAGPVRAHAWPVLAQQCGWARNKAGTLVLTAEGADLLHQFTPEKLRSGLVQYINDDEFDELNRINHIRGQSGKGRRVMSDPDMRKRVLQAALPTWPANEWLPFKEALRLVNVLGRDGDVLRSLIPALYFFDPQYGFIQDNSGLNSQFLRAVCMESLATLGVLDVGCVYPHHLWPDLKDFLNGDLPFCGRYDGLLYVRINPLGAYLCGITPSYEYHGEVEQKLFRVLPNFDVVLAADELNPADRASLEQMAISKGERTWTLDAGCMLTHVETGGSFQELRAYLEKNAEGGLPANVQAMLRQLESNAGACESMREAVLLEWAEEPLARFIATSAGLSRLCHHAGGKRIVVRRDNLTAFSRALKRLGYALPRPS